MLELLQVDHFIFVFEAVKEVLHLHWLNFEGSHEAGHQVGELTPSELIVFAELKQSKKGIEGHFVGLEVMVHHYHELWGLFAGSTYHDGQAIVIRWK